MEPTLDQVRQELADIHDSLLSTAPDDFTTRSQLKDRQNELRQLSSKLIEGEPLHDRAALKAAYERLQQVRDRLLDQHMSQMSTSVGDAGVDAHFTAAINKAMDGGLGIDEVEARMKEILEQMKTSG